jgi:hypothetical protein
VPDCCLIAGERQGRRREKERKKNKRNDGTHVWRGNGGPQGMEGESWNLEEYGK